MFRHLRRWIRHLRRWIRHLRRWIQHLFFYPPPTAVGSRSAVCYDRATPLVAPRSRVCYDRASPVGPRFGMCCDPSFFWCTGTSNPVLSRQIHTPSAFRDLPLYKLSTAHKVHVLNVLGVGLLSIAIQIKCYLKRKEERMVKVTGSPLVVYGRPWATSIDHSPSSIKELKAMMPWWHFDGTSVFKCFDKR